ncbi:MAG: hypothetical protein GC164_00245 [Phycisphaera sp.]|nr:hypothetical protein [Phycisphaera sp.]
MASITYDGKSFSIDGKRIWLVSGAIHYARVPRELWRSRIRAAKQAGLNCIETYCFWNAHEPTRGDFDFDGDLDVRAFVKMIGEEGMFCILRPGPYICAEWDFGGLPAWLHNVEGIEYRKTNGPFLEACSRYLSQVMEQVRDLQVTTSTGSVTTTGARGGPIVMIQVENEWFSDDPQHVAGYLNEIARYLRESGATVPLNECNNLWAPLEGVISTWNGRGRLPANLRQMAVVQPNAPRIVTEYWPGWFDHWGGKHANVPAQHHEAYLAGILASGAQYNLFMFHGGTNFGFFGGRTVGGPDVHMTTSYDYDAPLLEAGGRGEKYLATKRISVFANTFGHVLANLEKPAHSTFIPEPIRPDHPPALMHMHGPQGDVVFIIRHEQYKGETYNLLLPNGLQLPVPMGSDRVAWVLLDATLPSGHRLTMSNLRPWAFVGKRTLVLFGPAGASGLVSVNDAIATVEVPKGQTPTLLEHEGLQVVVLNHEQVDAAYTTGSKLYLGAASLDDQDQPVALKGWANTTVISDDKQESFKHKPTATPRAPSLTGWAHAPVTELLTGESSKYKPIKNPATLESLGQDFGYGFYRILGKIPAGSSVMAPGMEDRMHLYQDGKFKGLVGHGPGAGTQPFKLAAGDGLVAMVDNLGRFNYGWHLGEPKGLWDNLYTVKPIRLGKPTTQTLPPPDFSAYRVILTSHRTLDRTPATWLNWNINPTGRLPMILELHGFPHRCGVMVNNKLVGVYDPALKFARFTLHVGDALRGGRNKLTLALCEPADLKKLNLAKCVTLYAATNNLTAKAQWAFSPWSLPDEKTFQSLGKSVPGLSQPGWFKAEFNIKSTDAPLWLEPRGMSKGQLYINGHNAGRYFVATHTGKEVPPQRLYYLPEPWLHTDKPNTLLLFDEHGKHPGKCGLVYNAMGPYHK